MQEKLLHRKILEPLGSVSHVQVETCKTWVKHLDYVIF